MLDVIAPYLTIVFGAFLTLFVYSFLWKENPLSRAMEHLFIGLAAAYITGYVYDAAMKVAVLTGGRLKDGNLVWALPIIIGFMYLFFFTKKYFWLYRFPVSIVAGIGAGLVIVGNIQSNFVAQVAATVKLPLLGATSSAWEWFPLDNIFILIGVITALSFFFFTFEHTGPLGISARIGRYVMMAAFGSAYGFTVMARISLLIGRLRYLYETSEAGFYAYYLIPVVIVLMLIVAYWERTRKPSAALPPPTPAPAAAPPPEAPPAEEVPRKRKKTS